MRESNNIGLDQVKSESKTTEIHTDIIPQKTHNDLNSRKVNLENKLEMEDSNVLKRKSVSNIRNDVNPNKQGLNNLVYDNEAQFRMIANKFNEAVEVILELSDKVKKLEETIQNLSVKSIKNKKSNPFFNLKTFVFIIITTLFLLGLFTIPIDLSFIKLIIIDVISSI